MWTFLSFLLCSCTCLWCDSSEISCRYGIYIFKIITYLDYNRFLFWFVKKVQFWRYQPKTSDFIYAFLACVKITCNWFDLILSQIISFISCLSELVAYQIMKIFPLVWSPCIPITNYVAICTSICTWWISWRWNYVCT